MKMKKPCTLIAAIFTALLCLSTGKTALADDTDIYVNPSSLTTAEPMIMFALDLRSNLSSVMCNKFTPTDTDATIAANCGWDPAYVAYLTLNDKSDGVISLFEYFRASLAQAMAGLTGVKIGLMVPHNDNCTPPSAGPGNTGCSNGAYIMQGLNSINATDTGDSFIPKRTFKQEFFDHLANLPPIQGTVAHPYQATEMYFEFFRYLTGETVWNGRLGYKDYGNIDPVKNLDTDFPLISWDPSIQTKIPGGGYRYASPLASVSQCTKIYVINVAFGVTNNDDESNSAIALATTNGGMNLNLLGTGKNGGFKSVIQWMAKSTGGFAGGTFNDASSSPLTIGTTQTVSSFFLTDNVNTTTNGWAQAGNTNNAIALGTDPTALTNKLRNIFSQILSVSTTFVSASVPVNVFNRADYLDDVYMALFEAQKAGLPRWIGNLKKLKLMQDANAAWYIGDVYKNPAFGADGRINFNALTFWTDPTGTDVINFDPNKGEISGYDGRSINRGGAGQKMPGFLSGSVGLNNTDIGARQIFTEPTGYTNGIPAALMPLDATAANASALWNDLNATGTFSSGTILNNFAWSKAIDYATAPAAEQTEALDILKWARGIDVMDENANGIVTETRPWLMDDPIHSRPLAINYGLSTTNPDVRIVITGNDGFVHMVQNTDSIGNESGKENWAFIPRYAMRILDRLKNDGIGSPLHPYGVDGSPVLYTYDANNDGNIVAANGDKAYIYFGMRRGGRYYYAMDVSNPDKPMMLWSISNTTPGFSQLGLTFSRPQVAYLSYTESATGTQHILQPVLIFAGGYDTNKDTRTTAVGTNDTMGNAIYIVNAENGSLIWKAVQGVTGPFNETEYHLSDLTDSIPADVTVLDSDGDGSIDRLYVGDTGGQIFRADLAGLDRNKWTLRTFASVGRHDPYFAATGIIPTKADDRRFFHAVDVVQTRYNSENYDAVIVGSGDRANPLDLSIGSPVPQNWIYLFKDKDTLSGTTGNNLDLKTNSPSYVISQYAKAYAPADLTNDCMQPGASNNPCPATTLTQLNAYGWKIMLTQAVGEKVLSRPITVDGVIYWTTYLPPSSAALTASCEPLEGSGSIYAVNLQDATPAYNWDLTNSYTNASGTVIDYGATDRYMASGKGIPADVIVVRKGGNLQAILPGQNYTKQINTTSGYKTFWYTEGE